MFDRKKIGEILTDLGVLSPPEVEQVLTALRRRGDFAKFGQVAKDMGMLREEHILAALAVQMELFAKAGDMSLNHILGRLRAPVKSHPKLPMKELRRQLSAGSRRRRL